MVFLSFVYLNISYFLKEFNFSIELKGHGRSSLNGNHTQQTTKVTCPLPGDCLHVICPREQGNKGKTGNVCECVSVCASMCVCECMCECVRV